MENAAKALAIAAAVIFTLFVISLLVVLYNQLSSYYGEKNKMAEIDQLQEFNARFENYAGKELRGNEVISIINRIVDYNNLQADMQDYERITINISFEGHVDELAYDGNTTIINDPISNSSGDGQIKELASASVNLADENLTERKLQQLSANAHYIILDNPDDEEKIFRAQKLTRILGRKVEKNDNVDDLVNATKKYYQLTQFKRVVFECTEISYDTETGRVNGMEFVALEDEGKLKMD